MTFGEEQVERVRLANFETEVVREGIEIRNRPPRRPGRHKSGPQPRRARPALLSVVSLTGPDAWRIYTHGIWGGGVLVARAARRAIVAPPCVDSCFPLS